MITPPHPLHHEFRIPTIVGILLMITIVGGIIALFEWFSKKPTTAGGSVVPINVAVSNITDTGFTVVWMTPNPATGVVSLVSPKHTPSIFFDERDNTGTMKPYTTHSINLRGLTPATSYTFQILSNGKKYSQNDKPYSAVTAMTITGAGTKLEPAYGVINDESGSPVAGALVLVTIDEGQLLSTITSPSGSWILSLGLARTSSLTKYLDPAERLTETIRVMWGDEEASAITDTLNDAPVPTMILGKSYDFRKQQAADRKKTLLADTLHDTPAVFGDTTLSKSATAKTIGIAAPTQNASLTTSLPLIAGTGIPGKTVSLVVGITKPVSGTTTVGGDGIWRFTPSKPLAPGKQSVTATTVDQRGKPVAFTHTFTILKSGTQVLGEATPSATLTPTITPIATSSATPSATPTQTPTPTPELQGEPVPTSGTTLPTLLILLLGAGFLASGFVLFPR